MGYYLEEHPNMPGRPAQYGWPRTRASGVIGVHTTESGVVFSGADPGAENTARFISTRSDHGSYHMIADWDTIVPMTRPTFAAWADTTNNAHALSVSGAMNAARWRDLSPERAAQIVRNMGIAAAMLARDAVAHGVLKEVPPARRITAEEAIKGTRAGFYGHGETNPGTRYDPGTNFDWPLFLSSYAAAVGGSINYMGDSTPSEEDDMFTDDDRALLKTISSEATNAKNNAKWSAEEAQLSGRIAQAALQAISGLLHTQLVNPLDPDGYRPTVAEWLVWSNVKADKALQGVSKINPEDLAAAMAKAAASAPVSISLEDLAAGLQITPKESSK